MKIPNRTHKQVTLLSPGPVMLSRGVRRAAVDTVISHRGEDFCNLYDRTAENLKKIAHADDEYQVLLLTGSGTAANEAIISSTAALGNILVLVNGDFGERLERLSKLYHKAPHSVHFGWNKKMDMQVIEKKLASGAFSTIAMTHHETSTGMLNSVWEVAQMAKKYNCYIFVDAISSLGADELRLNEWGIDIVSCSSGKALKAMPGIGIVAATTNILDIMSQTQPINHYFNLANYYATAQNNKQTPNTPAVNLIAALAAATEELLNGNQDEPAQRAQYVRGVLKEQGIAFFDHGDYASSVLTCVILPEYVLFKNIADKLLERNIVVYDGKGPLQGKVMQIGHIGFFAPGQYAIAIGEIIDAYLECIREAVLRPGQVPARRLMNPERIQIT